MALGAIDFLGARPLLQQAAVHDPDAQVRRLAIHLLGP
jgi:hypothetical protein